MQNKLPNGLGHDHAIGAWEDFLALCEFGGRLTGSPGELAARDWAAERLATIGIGRVTREPTPYLGWRCLESRVDLADGEGVEAVPLLYSGNTPESGLELPVVDCGRGTPEDILAMGSRLQGCAALVRHEYMFATDTVHRRRKVDAAIKAGAAAFLIAAPAPGLGPVSGSAGESASMIPALGISAETAARITAGPGIRLRIRLKTEVHPDAQTETIILDLPGRSAERVVLSAHIDGHALGESALDNATGVAAALTIAQVVAPHVQTLPRGLKVCLFSAEEWALAGSRAWLAGLSDAMRQRLSFCLNLDTVLGGARLTALTSEFTELGQFAVAAARGLGTDLGLHAPLMRNSDHASFAAVGIPSLRLVSGFDELDSSLRLLLTRHDRRQLAAASDFLQPLRVAWSILRAALTASADQLAALRPRQYC